MSKQNLSTLSQPDVPVLPTRLLDDLRTMIDQTKQSIAATVNTGLTLLYWHIGSRIRSELLQNERAEYGSKIVATVSRQLAGEYGKGFVEKSLRRMIQFAEVFPDHKVVNGLTRQLSWSHFKLLLPLKDEMKRDFYAEMCRIEKWNVRTLSKKIDSMLFERTALSKKPDELARLELDALRKEDQMTPDLVLRDPYVLEFLNLDDRYVEKDLEDAIMRELEQFLLEFGVGFSFLARQKRIVVDSIDFHLDLLFFHRHLRRLIAIELKIGDFKPEYKGQMELYLRWLDRYERQPGEESPIGLILCTGKNHECIELLELDKVGIHVAEYLTAMPSKEDLLKKLKQATKRAKQRLAIASEELHENDA
jgi:predicted nuclease of restriction endonuclease-like (RecB) superfamily